MTTKTLPVLPLRDIVVFPDMVAPLFVGRDKSVRALEMVDEGQNEIMLVAQKDASLDEPTPDDLHEIGTVGMIMRMLKMPDGNTTVIIQGKKRFELIDFIQTDLFQYAPPQANVILTFNPLNNKLKF